ncbi:MAG: hypothetical protein WC725_00690 [Patescibacteria group bacterium]|jgi:uncharacterized protein YbaR (Trm112 family)
MALFICPNCEQRSEIKEEDDKKITSHVCPHCGQTYNVDQELNVILEE